MRNRNFFSLLGCLAIALLFAACEEKEAPIVPTKKNVSDAVFASGYVEQANTYTVSTKVEGILQSLAIQEGDQVKRNSLIATVESDVQRNQLADALVVYADAVSNAAPGSPQLQNLQAQLDQAEQQLAFDKDNYLRYQGLLEKNSVAKLDVEKAKLQYEAAQSNLQALQESYADAQGSLALQVERSSVQVNTQQSLLADYRMTTEEAGTVIQVFKTEGELVRKGEALAKMASGEYVIKLYVAEDDITKVDIGQAVAVNINTYPDRSFAAEVIKIYPGFDETEQSYLVEARFTVLPEKMFNGTQLQANIATGNRKDVLMVPSDYLANGNVVTLESGLEKAIEIGSKNRDWTEVISGLTETDVIVKPIN